MEASSMTLARDVVARVIRLRAGKERLSTDNFTRPG